MPDVLRRVPASAWRLIGLGAVLLVAFEVPLQLDRPNLSICVLVAAAVFVASPVHSSADEAVAGFWRQYGLSGVEKLVLISLWLWVTFTATRLLVARLSRRPTARR